VAEAIGDRTRGRGRPFSGGEELQARRAVRRNGGTAGAGLRLVQSRSLRLKNPFVASWLL